MQYSPFFLLDLGDFMHTTHVEFINLHEDKLFYKKQCRKNGLARQVITNGVVLMKAKYVGQLLRIRGWVRREPNAAKLCEDHNGPVLICGDDNQEKNLIKSDDTRNITVENGCILVSDMCSNCFHIITFVLYIYNALSYFIILNFWLVSQSVDMPDWRVNQFMATGWIVA